MRSIPPREQRTFEFWFVREWDERNLWIGAGRVTFEAFLVSDAQIDRALVERYAAYKVERGLASAPGPRGKRKAKPKRVIG